MDKENLNLADNAENVIDDVTLTDGVDASTDITDVDTSKATDVNKEENTPDNGADNTNIDDNIDKTKAFSKRLSEERAKIEREYADKEANIILKNNKFAQDRGFKDFDDMQEYAEQEKLKTLGVQDTEAFKDVLNQYIENNPTVLEAKEVIKKQQLENGTRLLNEQISEISKIDADIKSFDDIYKMENRETFDNLIKKGYSMVDAYKISNFEKLSSKTSAKAKQQVLNGINSKEHLKTSSGAAGSDIIVPTEIMAQYKESGLTEDEARKHYAKMHK